MRRFRKRPVMVEAMQWTGDNWKDALDFIVGQGSAAHTHEGVLMIETGAGFAAARPGDWVIKDTEGRFYPCKQSIFDSTYEQVA